MITTLKKHVNANHKLIAKKIEKEMKNMKSRMEKQIAIFIFLLSETICPLFVDSI